MNSFTDKLIHGIGCNPVVSDAALPQLQSPQVAAAAHVPLCCEFGQMVIALLFVALGVGGSEKCLFGSAFWVVM